MKEIELTRGKVALVDDEDYITLSQYKWHAHFDGTNWYARRNAVASDNKRCTIQMHRDILKPTNGLSIDHVNHDGLDNRRENLRTCTHCENLRNQRKQKSRSSKYKGVGWRVRLNAWRAYITHGGKRQHLGYFDSEVDAACAYDAAAIRLFGEFALLNILDSSEAQTYNHKHDRRNNTSGYTGVSWSKSNQKWKAQTNINGKRKGLGYFSSKEDAAVAYQNAVGNRGW